MKRKTMVCFVDDEVETIDEVLTELRMLKLFEVRHYSAYGLVPEDVIQQADLFILDVWTGSEQTSGDFVRFAGRISGIKPFFAFTTALERSQLSLPTGKEKGLRDFVLSKAGLGVVSKRDKFGDRWRYEFRLDLLQKVLNFHWSRQID